jgi:hypothetical protein
MVTTKDVEEAAFLWCQDDIVFEKAECRPKNSGGTSVFFHFSVGGSQNIDALKKSFYNKQSKVEPKAYSGRLKDIHDILHNALRAERG